MRLRPHTPGDKSKSDKEPRPEPKAKFEPLRRTGTELVPYEDVERFGFQDLRASNRASTSIFSWPLKAIRTALFMVAVIAFAGGLYDNISWGAHKVFGVQSEGVVIKLDAAAAGLSTPTVAYTDDLEQAEWTSVSRLPRADLALGDKVAVSVIPGSEGLTRIERSSTWRMISLIALIGGAVGMWMLSTMWAAVERIFGISRLQESAVSMHSRTVVSLMIAIVLIGAAWMKFIYTPWLGFAEFRYLITDPDKAMRAAGERCGDLGTGPLNACELRVLGMPVIGDTAAIGAYNLAVLDSDFTSLARYHAAIANSEMNFAFDWPSSAPFLLNTDPDVLLGLLATGVTPPPGVAEDLLAGAEARNWAEVSAALRRSAEQPNS